MNCWHCETELIWGGDHDMDGEDYPIMSGEYSIELIFPVLNVILL